MIASTILILLAGFAGMAIFNLFSAVRLEAVRVLAPARLPKVSVLIPARNEELNLARLLPSLIRSEVKPHEILVLDDESSDGTAGVANEILSRSGIPYRVIAGQPWHPENGMLGKNHACQQLADAASGEVLLFCDADLIVSPRALGKTLTLLRTHPAAGLSGLPRQLTLGLREKQVLPWVMQIPLVLTLPLGFAWKWRVPSMQMANGQWLAIWKALYETAGGHRAVGSEVVEDVALARRFTRLGLGGVLPVIAVRDLEVAMYPDWNSLVNGFAKNLVLIFGGSVPAFLMTLFVIDGAFSFPLWGWLVDKRAAGASIVLILICRWIAARLFGISPQARLIPNGSLFRLNQLAFQVLRRKRQGRVEWKGRGIQLDDGVRARI